MCKQFVTTSSFLLFVGQHTKKKLFISVFLCTVTFYLCWYWFDEDDNGIIMWWDVMMIVLGCAPFLFSCCLSIKSIKKERRVPPSSFAFLWWTTCCLCGGLVLVLVLALWPGLVVWSGMVLCRVLSYSSSPFLFLLLVYLGWCFFWCTILIRMRILFFHFTFTTSLFLK